MTIILGVSNTSHDSSAAVFKDGELVSAIAQERLSRIKCHGKDFPQQAVDEVLSQAGVSRSDVDHIALMSGYFSNEYIRRPSFSAELRQKWVRLRRRLRGKPSGLVWTGDAIREAQAKGQTLEQCFRKDVFLAQEGFRADAKIHFASHHDVHALLAGFYSGFKECLCITADGRGDLDDVHSSWIYRNGKLEQLSLTQDLGGSAGFFYAAITELLGFMPVRHEGKVLGLAAFGDPEPLRADFSRALRLSADGLRFESDFDGGNSPDDERYTFLRKVIQGHSRENVAAAAQQVLEDVYVAHVRTLVAKTGIRKVAMNGGVAANVKLNQRVSALPEVDSIFVFPAMSDAGNSVGAALFAQGKVTPGYLAAQGHALQDVYLGPGFSDDEIAMALAATGLSAQKLTESELIDRTARAIHEGYVVGWYQGRMEFGPRALGNRSMIGRPTDAEINKALNDRLERTEFMPFAPSVLAEFADALFEHVEPARHAAEFMTVTFDVKPEWHDRIPAVVHVDGTARPQLVRSDRNPLYHAVISRYQALSGIPLVLNTSFNVHEEPIVCAPAEALRAVSEDRIDALAIGNFWVDNIKRGIFR